MSDPKKPAQEEVLNDDEYPDYEDFHDEEDDDYECGLICRYLFPYTSHRIADHMWCP